MSTPTDSHEQHTLNFKATLVILSLFVAINLGLATLLDDHSGSNNKLEAKVENAKLETAVKPDLKLKADEPKLQLAKTDPAKTVSPVEASKLNQQDLLTILSKN